MKNRIVGFFICILLIITIVPSINGTESKNINIKSTNNNEVDLVASAQAWWSPAPWINGDILGYFLTIENKGDSYKGEDIWINFSIYFIYSDHEELYTENRISYSTTYIGIGIIQEMYDTPILNEKPEKIRFEIDTNVPESNKENNVIIEQVNYGVTFYGMIYRNVLVNNYPVSGGIVYCNSDVSTLSNIGTGIYRDGHYIISVPKDATKSPFNYTLQVVLGLGALNRIRVIKTPPLDEFEYAIIDFNFGFRDRSFNPWEILFQRIITLFPIL